MTTTNYTLRCVLTDDQTWRVYAQDPPAVEGQPSRSGRSWLFSVDGARSTGIRPEQLDEAIASYDRWQLDKARIDARAREWRSYWDGLIYDHRDRRAQEWRSYWGRLAQDYRERTREWTSYWGRLAQDHRERMARERAAHRRQQAALRATRDRARYPSMYRRDQVYACARALYSDYDRTHLRPATYRTVAARTRLYRETLGLSRLACGALFDAEVMAIVRRWGELGGAAPYRGQSSPISVVAFADRWRDDLRRRVEARVLDAIRSCRYPLPQLLGHRAGGDHWHISLGVPNARGVRTNLYERGTTKPRNIGSDWDRYVTVPMHWLRTVHARGLAVHDGCLVLQTKDLPDGSIAGRVAVPVGAGRVGLRTEWRTLRGPTAWSMLDEDVDLTLDEPARRRGRSMRRMLDEAIEVIDQS